MPFKLLRRALVLTCNLLTFLDATICHEGHTDAYTGHTVLGTPIGSSVHD